jgi:hypothetical protein
MAALREIFLGRGEVVEGCQDAHIDRICMITSMISSREQPTAGAT